MRYTRSLLAILAILALTPIANPALAQYYPDRPIHIIVPFPAGGPADVMARLISERMGADFGQGVVVDNRPGANTVIGAEFVAKAPPDGYTLLMAIDSTLVMNQYLYSHLPYDPVKDFVPITVVAKTMDLLVVNASSDIKTAKDLVAKAKAQPGKLNCGAGTIATKLTCVLFNEKAGVDTVLLPYNGSAEVAHGILTKSVDFVFDGPSAVLPLVSSGDLRALAKLDPARCRRCLTADAQRRDRHRSQRHHGLARPRRAARHAAAIVDKLAAETAKILSDPQVKARANAVGLFPVTNTPAEFAAFIQHEAARWPEVVKRSGLHFD